MRSKLITLIIACGLAAAAAPALACPFETQASTDQQKQTAQVQPPSETKTQ